MKKLIHLVSHKIIYYLIRAILKCLSFLPLTIINYCAIKLGLLLINKSNKAKLRVQNNLLKTKLANIDNLEYMTNQVAIETGKTLLEALLIAWSKNKYYNYKLIANFYNLDLVEPAVKQDTAILFLTPHIGNFEIALKATAHMFNKQFNILYKPNTTLFLEDLMYHGRSENNIKPLPTNTSGISSIVRAIKNKELIGILPDSVASQGEGVWVNFFENKIFAPILVAKLILSYKIPVFIVASKRNNNKNNSAINFDLEYIPFNITSTNAQELMQEIYNILEAIIKKNPTQYYWSYDRFRIPKSNQYLKPLQ